MKVYEIIIKGKCVVADGARKCECEPGWEGDYCTIVSCNNYNICPKGRN